MRVKEHPTSAEMAKKRNKTKQNDYHNTSDEEILRAKICAHMDKAVNLSGIKKGLKQAGGSSKLGQCVSCVNDKGASDKHSAACSEDSLDHHGNTTWLCLFCGNQGCGRGSQHQHALKHYETPRSASHTVSLCVDTMAVWCYKCDENIYPEDSRKLLECVEWIRKELGAPKLPAKKKSKDSDGEPAPTKGPTVSDGSSTNNIKVDGVTRVKGLNNLGNTCFFNAVMQNITQTQGLRELLHEKWTVGKEVCIPEDTHLSVTLDTSPPGQMLFWFDTPKKPEELGEPVAPITVGLPAAGSLTSSLISFLDEMNKAGKSNIINPRGLFNQICQKASRFKGYQQQDSHELLRYLLDGMRAEEIKRMQEAILAHFDIKGSKVKNLDEATKKKIKAYGQHCRHTFVDSVFSGQLLSSVHCNECNVVSEVLEPFLDLSLPIVESKGKRNTAPPRPSEKPTLLEKSAEAAAPVAQATGLKEIENKMSKHQIQKAREKAKKDAKRKHRKSQSGQRDSAIQGGAEGTPIQSDEEEAFQDSNDADSETSLFDRPGRKSSVDFTRTVRTTGSSYGLSNKANNPVQPGVEASKDKESASGITKDESNPDRTKNHQSPPDIDTDEETDKLVGQMKGMTLKEKTNAKNNLLNPTKTALAATSLENINGNLSEKVRPTSSSDSYGSTSKLNDQTSSQTQPEHVACNGLGSSTGDSTSSTKDTVVPTDPKSQANAFESTSEANKSSIACGYTPVRLAKQEDFSPPVSPASPTRTRVMSTLAPRYQGKSLECSVESCLSQFTAPEWLTGPNRFGCEHCSKNADVKDKEKKIVYTDASKQLLIHQPPSILTLHLKRFQQVGYSLRKITRHINFPLVLDLAPFCSTSCKPYSDSNQQVLYALYGIVEHSGRLHFGHYTAYVKVRQPSDTLRQYIHQIPRNLNSMNELWNKTNGLANGEDSGTESAAKAATSCNSHDSQAPASAAKRSVTPPEGKWFYISDSHVSEVQESKVLSAQAYILFYERIV
ncbi:ubiquitin carboxyl-terminal hydrolase 16-like [Acanthaster planci]|uniref:Ubiquitin carboxyl-terminal hydrolase 16-like n=1 Tax=Acanthaster planci TaxID=133434 RepID=A0A8B7XNB7_ACAPL|nr:ubiquitin carboxyl-terminal hydrolase 16-like [Acanthaster planci]